MFNGGQLKRAFGDRSAFWPGFLYFPFSNFKMLRDIGARLWEDEIRYGVLTQIRVKQRSIRLSGFHRIINRGQDLIIYLYQLGSFDCNILGDSHHSRHWFTIIPDPLIGEDRAVDQVKSHPRIYILPGHNCSDSRKGFRLGGIDLFDQGMRIWTANQTTVKQVGTKLNIIHKNSTSSDLIDHIGTLNTLSNDFGFGDLHLAPPFWEALRTASMIL